MQVFLASWLVNALTLYIIARFLPGIGIKDLVPAGGFITTSGLISVLIGGLLLGFLNSVVRPILAFFSLPLTCLTLGLFSFILTGFIFYLAAFFTPGMYVTNFWWAILGGVLFGFLNSLISGFLGVKKSEEE